MIKRSPKFVFFSLLSVLVFLALLIGRTTESFQFSTASLFRHNLVTTIAGNGTETFAGDGGQATSASLYLPEGVAVDAQDDVYIADFGNSRIRKVDVSTGLISTVAGNGTAYSGDGGLATSAGIGNPRSVFVDDNGDIYIGSGFRVRKVDNATGNISTVAGASNGYSGDGGPAISASMSEVRGLVVDSNGNIFISDGFNNVIRRVDAGTGIITTYAGIGTNGFSGDGGLASAAELYIPMHLDIDANDNLYVVDQFNLRIRKIDSSTGIITTIAGNGNSPGIVDVQATSTGIGYVEGVAVDTNGEVYIADNLYYIYKVETSGIIRRLGGITRNFSGDGGPFSSAGFDRVIDLDIDSSGNLYIADEQNDRIRKVSLGSGVAPTFDIVSITPSLHSIDVSVVSTISVVFDDTLNTATVNQSSLPIYGELSGLINGVYSYSTTSKTNDTVTFTPTDDFLVGERVDIVVTDAVTSSSAVAISPYVSSFIVEVPQQATGFSAAVSQNTSSQRPFGIAGLDVENDGDIDVAIAHVAGIDIFENNGSGIFTPGTVLTSAGETRNLVAADLDRDGNMDLVRTEGALISVFLGNGNGTFQTKASYSMSGTGRAVRSSDFDGDGVLDIAAASTDALAIFIGNGNGTFKTVVEYSLGVSLSYGLAVGDLDEDGSQDIVIGAQTLGNMPVYLNQGDGTFVQNGSVTSGNVNMDLVDVNGDAHLDLISGGGGGFFEVSFGDGNGGFGAPVNSGSPRGSYRGSDIDSDGDLDLVASSTDLFNIYIKLNNGSGVFSSEYTVSTNNRTMNTVVADFNADDIVDVAATVFDIATLTVNQLAVSLGLPVNTLPTATVPTSISQTTDGSGQVSFQITVSDTDSDSTRFEVQYSEDGGSNFYDAQLVSATPSAGTVDLNNATQYQVGSSDAIDTDSGSKTLTIVWDTQSASNGNGALIGDQSDIQLRVIPNDSIGDGSSQTTSNFSVDNQSPVGLTLLSSPVSSATEVDLEWTSVTESNFSHYEIWVSETQSEVVNRNGSAIEWDDSDDVLLTNIATNTTTVTGLDSGKSYFFKIFALDTYGNIETVVEISLDTPNAGGRRRATQVTPMEVDVVGVDALLEDEATLNKDNMDFFKETDSTNTFGSLLSKNQDMHGVAIKVPGALDKMHSLISLFEWMDHPDYQLTESSQEMFDRYHFLFRMKAFLKFMALNFDMSDGYTLKSPEVEPLENYAELFKTLMFSFSECFTASQIERAISHDRPDNGWWWAGYWYFLGGFIEGSYRVWDPIIDLPMLKVLEVFVTDYCPLDNQL